MKRLIPVLTTLGVAALAFCATSAFAGVAAAAQDSPPDVPILDLLRPIYEGFVGGHFGLASALAVVLLVAVVRRYAPGAVGRWANTDSGGTILTLVSAGASSLAASLALPEARFTWGLLGTAFSVGIAAIGGYIALKRILLPYLERLTSKHWILRYAVRLVTWIFDSRSPVEEAEAAGDAAVAANPPKGASAIAGEPEKF